MQTIWLEDYPSSIQGIERSRYQIYTEIIKVVAIKTANDQGVDFPPLFL
jgi:hypothetical protein